MRQGAWAELHMWNFEPYYVEVTDIVFSHMKKLIYTDCANGSADSIELLLYNRDQLWLTQMYTVKGYKFHCEATIHYDISSTLYDFGVMILDTMKYSGSEINRIFVSSPAHTSFNTLEREQSWQNVEFKEIVREIAARYGLRCDGDGWYNAEPLYFDTITQDNKTDSAFLYETADKYGLNMKIMGGRVLIYDPARLEAAPAAAILTRRDFYGNSWSYEDTIDGAYTGAVISYRDAGSGEDISIYVGCVPEGDPSARTLKVSDTAPSAAAAQVMAKAAVNRANEKGITMSCTVKPISEIYAGSVVVIDGMGGADGRYFVDKMMLSISGSDGVTKDIEMHRIVPRI